MGPHVELPAFGCNRALSLLSAECLFILRYLLRLWILAGSFRANVIFVELRVGAVTVRRIVGVFALAEECVAVFFCHEALGTETRTCVRAVAEGLVVGTPAGAEHVLFVFLQRDFFWLVVCNDGIAHRSSPCCW